MDPRADDPRRSSPAPARRPPPEPAGVRRLLAALLGAFALATYLAPPAPRARASPGLRVTPAPSERSESGEAGGVGAQPSPCPAGMLPDAPLGPGGRDDEAEFICVRLPSVDAEEDERAAFPLAVANVHRERSGRWAAYEQIPRRPERPAAYEAYRYPVPTAAHGARGTSPVVSGYDLDLPDARQRRGATLHAVGHGGLDLPQPRGTPVSMLPLEHQQGDADVLYVGPLFGTTVLTRQTVREAGELRDYVVLFGHLDAPASGLHPGATLKEGDLVGFVGDTGSPELVHLHYETRRVRPGIDVLKRVRENPGSLVQDAVSIVCDPRNVLPLRGADAP